MTAAKPQQQAKPTPGPWRAESTINTHRGWKAPEQIISVWSGEVLIAYYSTGSGEYPSEEECAANAALIAEAGTVFGELGLTTRQLADQRAELLAALESALAVIRGSDYEHACTQFPPHPCAPLGEVLRAAIAKAKQVAP